MRLSVIVPSIRSENLVAFDESIKQSYSGEYELIIVSPYRKLPELDCIWIESRAHPTVCQQLGLIQAKGDYVCFGWDDGWFLPGMIDKMFTQLEPNSAISGKYIEGYMAPTYMASTDYYRVNTHDRAASPYLSNDIMLVNTGLVPRGTLLEIGGFDCRFESTGISAVDMAIRLQLHGVKVILSDDVVLKCSWLEGDAGDHGPIHAAVESDFNLLHKKYRQPIFSKRIIIDINNYKSQPVVWSRRFS